MNKKEQVEKKIKEMNPSTKWGYTCSCGCGCYITEQPQLADVLWAINQTGNQRYIGWSIRPNYGCFLRFDEDGTAISCAEENSWNLLKPFSEQSDELYSFLFDLICK